MQRFKNEAIITRKLQHPNAVRVDDLDIGEDGRPFIAMELVEGETLKGLILRSGPVGVSQTLEIALQVCQALQAAHALGLIHRDIKPDNIFLVPRRDAGAHVKVLDFGIARLKEGSPGRGLAGVTLTGTGVVIGTPEYMSPEQAMGKHGDQLDGRSDLYSLGIVIYRMLTGELPFKADTTVEMILHHIQTIPKPPQALKPELRIPSDISAIVMKALEKDPEQRFASAAAMADALRHAQASLGAAGRVSAEVLPAARAATAAPPPQPQKPPSPAPGMLEGPTQDLRAPAAAPPRRAQAKPARVEPSAPPPAKEKVSPTRNIFWAALALVLVIAWVAGLKRRKAEQTQPAPAPQVSQPSGAPATSAAKTSERFTTTKKEVSLPPTKPSAAPTREAARSTEAPAGRAQEFPSEPVREINRQPVSARESVPEAGPGGMSPSGRSKRPEFGASEQVGDGAAGKRREISQLAEAGRRFYEAGQYGKTAQMFRRILKIDPNNQRAQQALPKCMEKLRERRPGARGRLQPGDHPQPK